MLSGVPLISSSFMHRAFYCFPLLICLGISDCHLNRLERKKMVVESYYEGLSLSFPGTLSPWIGTKHARESIYKFCILHID